MSDRYRKKPVVIEAVQWRGMNHEEVKEFLGDDYVGLSSKHHKSKVIVQTLEGTITADWGDWLIRGIQGEHYPCKPDIFEATYEVEIFEDEQPAHIAESWQDEDFRNARLADTWDEGSQRGWNVGWRHEPLPINDNPYKQEDA